MKGLALRLYARLLGMAVALVAKGRVTDGLKLLIAPVGYWRMLPNAIIWRELMALNPSRVLDVSSPKPLTLLVGSRWNVTATDLNDPLLFSRWKPSAVALGLTGIEWAYEDARALPYPDESYDAAYSVSVIEHIPGDGDRAALTEMARIVRPGGIVIVEVPLRHAYEERSAAYDSKGAPIEGSGFYERYYDAGALERRLNAPHLRLRSRLLLGEHLAIDPLIAQPVLPRALRIALLPLEPWLSALNYTVSESRVRGRPLAAVLIFDRVAA